ncbi:hypothetical protein BKG88_08620 [Rodentibacter ratti]|uniref:Uncharacterized protein n=2 Tax=Rodentibacter ratti TaxID=1906745 RepID=A0A1V3L5F1_9PAST|nr:hypothetical protein BKG88_08620 [Rodentibacter ratti]
MSFDCQGAFWIGYYQYSKLKDDVKNYTPSHLSIIGEALYGNQWQTNLARDLNLSDARRIRQWMAGERKIPIGVWSDIVELLKSKQKRIEDILSEMVEAKA